PLRVFPVLALALLVQRRARNEPRNDMRYARPGVSMPYEKLWTVSTRLISEILGHRLSPTSDLTLANRLVTRLPGKTREQSQNGSCGQSASSRVSTFVSVAMPLLSGSTMYP